jgi:hypothetical protein
MITKNCSHKQIGNPGEDAMPAESADLRQTLPHFLHFPQVRAALCFAIFRVCLSPRSKEVNSEMSANP